MHITLRSQLIVGTAAIVGATAIAVTPVTVAQLNIPSLPAPTVAQVTLAGFNNPVSNLFATLGVATNYLFNATSNFGDAASWPNSGFSLGTLLPAALATDALGGFNAVGLIPQINNDAFPVFQKLVNNGSAYINATTNALTSAGYALTEGVWTATGQALSLQFAQALATLGTAVNTAGTTLLAAGSYVFTNVVRNLTAALPFIPSYVQTQAAAFIAGANLVAQQAIGIVTTAAGQLASANYQGAWNTVVDGLTAPSGLLGTLLNTTIGAGVQTGVINNPSEIAANFVPSDRGVIQAAVKGIAGALTLSGTPPSPPPAAARNAASRPAPVAARAAAAHRAPAAAAHGRAAASRR
ncbi:MAG: hypothetical protein ACOYEV_03410 [Candidatus Nanopelagicales bacterium]